MEIADIIGIVVVFASFGLVVWYVRRVVRRRTREMAKQEKPFFVPILITLGTGIAFLGLSLVWALWLADKLCIDFALPPTITMISGLFVLRWGAVWYGQSERKEEPALSSNFFESGSERPSVDHKDIRHEVLVDRGEPYFMGEMLGFRARLKNLVNEPCIREFWYRIWLPDGMYLDRPLHQVQFEPYEEKLIPLGDPIFLGFLGIMRVTIVVGEAENLLLTKGTVPKEKMTFWTLFAGYSRDREGYATQKQLVKLTARVGWLTVAVIVLTAALIGFNIFGLT